MLDRIKDCINSNPRFTKALYWTKLITVTGSAQIVVQAVGFISGILVVRLLPVEEYALYTLANTMLGTMTILSDGGISTGVMAQGGKVWQDKGKLGAVLTTGLELRRKFAVFSLLISIPILCYLLQSHGASWVMTILISASLIPAFFSALSDVLLQIPPKLNQAIIPLQRNQVEVGIGRLVLTAITLFAFPWAFVAIIAGGIPRIYGNIKLRKITNVFVNKEQQSDPEVKGEIVKVVRRMMPAAIYYSLSGQITIWVLSILGSTASVAQIGALSRFSLLFNFFASLFSFLVIPRFSRLVKDRRGLVLYSVYILLGVFALVLIILICVMKFNPFLLKLLGVEYESLNKELFYSFLGSSINLIAATAFSLYNSRGWAIHPAILIVLNLCTIIVGFLVYDIGTLRGALYFNIFSGAVLSVINILYLFKKVRD